ncbi:MAG TPA: NAD(P)-dependent oxidoreductase [Steroidobacteraceae bacterium]|jgi:3-hydroxyisobutyrate dehydrogenase
MQRVAFVGLGRMGIGMARRLLDNAHELRVFNRTASRADELVALGARAFLTPREACDGADAVVAMVADDEASREVWLAPDGALAATLAPGALAIECSTLSHDWVLELAATAVKKGLRYIDAPVTGLPESAAAGELTLLVGATPEHLAAGRPLLSRFSQRILHFGPVGAGTAYKLLVNMLGAVQIASAAETMALAERAGLDLALVAEALSTGQAASPQVIRNAHRISRGDHDENVIFTPQLRLKDVEYALRLARKLRIGSPFGALSADVYRQLCTLGPEQINESKIIDVARAQPPTRTER